MMCKGICDVSTSHVRLEVRSAAANEDKNARKDGNRRDQHIVVTSTGFLNANKVLCVGSFWSKNEEKVIITIQQYILVFSHVSSSLVASSILIQQKRGATCNRTVLLVRAS